jgi:hypothetical protein
MDIRGSKIDVRGAKIDDEAVPMGVLSSSTDPANAATGLMSALSIPTAFATPSSSSTSSSTRLVRKPWW